MSASVMEHLAKMDKEPLGSITVLESAEAPLSKGLAQWTPEITERTRQILALWNQTHPESADFESLFSAP